MVRIVVTPEQALILATATESVEIVDANGQRLGFLARPFSAEDIAEAQRRAQSNEPRWSTAQALERLKTAEPQ